MKNFTRNIDRMWCYAAFALVMECNEARRASMLINTMQREFPKFTKLFYTDNIAQALSCHDAAHMFSKERQQSNGQAYQLVPKFYDILVGQVRRETKPLFKSLEEGLNPQAIVTASVQLLYKRQMNDYDPPTMMSVFRQAREIYENTR